MTKPRVLFAYRFGVLGGVATQLLNRYSEFSQRFDVQILFEEDHGVSGRFPPDVAVAISESADRVDHIRDVAPDLTVIIDSPSLLKDWNEAGRIGAAVLEVHTTTANISYLDRLDGNAGIRGIMTVSEYMRGVVEQSPIAAEVPVSVVSNCLESSWFRAGTGAHDIPAPGVPVVWVGKLDGHKRILSALDTMERLVVALEDEIDVVPVVVGGYASGADRVKHLLHAAASRPGLRDRFEWIPRVDYSIMPSLLASAGSAGGLCLSTTRNESFGMSLAESLASGCRVVAPRVGALPEIVPDEMLYPEQDLEAAVSLAAAMLRDPRLHSDAMVNASRSLQATMVPSSTLAQFVQALHDFGLDL